MRDTTLTDLRYEDLEKVPPEDVTHIAEWLTEKVDALSSRLKAEQREDEVRLPVGKAKACRGCGEVPQ